MNICVIAGPANTGKYPLARSIMEHTKSVGHHYVLIHRDRIRESMITEIKEDHLTYVMLDLARALMRERYSVLIVAQNMHDADSRLWKELREEFDCTLTWLDTRDPSVIKMIPPMDDERRWKQWGMEQEVGCA